MTEGATPMPSVALVMPAFNEAHALGGVMDRVYECFDKMGIGQCAVIVVDDGSTDETPMALADIACEYPIAVITHSTNLGYGRALRTGFEAALATGHEWVAHCHADGQFDPADLSMLLNAALSQNVDVVLGVRTRRADNLARRALGSIWRGISRLILKCDASDFDCGFQVLHRSAVVAVAPELRSDRAAISPELLARLHRTGHRMVEVPVRHYPRANGSRSRWNPKTALRSLVDLCAVRRELSADQPRRMPARSPGLPVTSSRLTVARRSAG
jgi:glycosyltransferase involved in cell wall biosynthesis